MGEFLLFVFACCLIIGLIQGAMDISKVKKHPELGVKPSKNLITFLFWDY
jgi:hypothetical protein